MALLQDTAYLSGPRSPISCRPLIYTVVPLDRRYSICTVEAISDNCFTELVFCGLKCFPAVTSFSKTVNTMEGNGNSCEEGYPGFDTDILNTVFFFSQLLKLPPGSKVKSAHIYPPWRG